MRIRNYPRDLVLYIDAIGDRCTLQGLCHIPLPSLRPAMVKRPKSPEAAEEDKYFTVYKPYPLNANWELEEDTIACSRWVASCIGTDPLHALYYKPSVRFA